MLRKIVLIVSALIALTVASMFYQGSAHASTSPTPHIILGVNRGNSDAFFADVPGARAVRVYYDQPDVFPKVWPSRAGKGIWSLLSIRPMPSTLLGGKLDTELKALIASAPAHSFLTIWHENAVGNNPLGYPAALRNPKTYVKMQLYMMNLVKNSHVRFGTIGCGPVNQAEKWYARGLNWYGYDFYDNAKYYRDKHGHLDKTKQWARMTANFVAFQKVSGEPHPQVVIPETNSSVDANRVNWFTWETQWFAHHNGNRRAWVLTYWNPKGGLSGPWPPSAPVIARLKYIGNTYR